MILGMSTSTFTLPHVAISLVGILAGFIVLTSPAALAQGEAEIDRIGQQLHAAGRL
jgi:hypothetical protein